MTSVEYEIAGGYQLDALLRGSPLQRAWHRARLDLIERVLPPTTDSLVLDAAAGSGIVTWKFQRRTIVSADMRVSACQAIRAHTPAARTTAAHLWALPFLSGTFLQVYFLEAIEHLTMEQGQQALAELRRVARPGARCLITTPNYRSYWAPLERLVDWSGLAPPLADAQHVTRYNSGDLAHAVGATDWTILRLGSFNLLAPFLGVLSARIGAWAVGREVSRARRGGALLYALCETQ